MSKMNRRDYLRLMGAAGAFAGVSTLLPPSLSAKAAKEDQNPVIRSGNNPTFLFTPKTNTPPGPTNLTVLFTGLMGFSNTSCCGAAQVGFQKGKGKHKLRIEVYQIAGESCSLRFAPISTNGVKTIQLEIPGETPNVNYFHKDDFKRELIDNDMARAKDFGWVLDFEDSLLYADGVKMRRKFSPILTLKQGTFYTHQLSRSKFDLVEVRDGDINTPLAPLNQVPLLVGTAINIPAGKRAVLRINDVIAAELPYAANVRYQIQFLNHCVESNGDHCKWDYPEHEDEEVRNDFYMHYRMFKTNSPYAKRCGVKVVHRVEHTTLDMCPVGGKRATDEAPCMGMGFGLKTGF